MFKSIISFLSNLFHYLNAYRYIELGRLRERERNRKEIEEKKRIADEAKSNIVNLDDRIKWLHDNSKPPKR